MAEAPSLVSLCLNAIADELIRGDADDDFARALYELPAELLDSLLPRLSPLALELLQRSMPFDGPQDDNSSSRRKRKRWLNFEMAWKMLYETRWPSRGNQSLPIYCLAEKGEAKDEIIDDWGQLYWETHLQNCVDAAAEIASLPSFTGGIGSIGTPVALLEYIGNRRHWRNLLFNYSKFSDHCQHFGSHARCLRLASSLCAPEICHLLKNTMLENLEIQWIKSEKHVDGLCALLKQNCETLKSMELIHCKLSAIYLNRICDSLWIKGLKTHGIQHFSIKLSSVQGTDYFSTPDGLASFLASGRSLSSLSLCDDRLQTDFVKMVLDALFDAPSDIAVLDLSDNCMPGYLSHFKIGKSLQSLRVLSLRNTFLERDDAKSLRCILLHMPKLESLDLSDNSIEEDGILSMIPYFAEMAERPHTLVSLKLGNCELTYKGVSQLLETLSTWKKPLSSLSLRENNLGRKMGALLGKFLHQGIQSLDIDDIELGPHGFQEAQEAITGNLKLVYIDISKNRGGIETAKFLSKLISCGPELVAIDAKYNFMPVESLSIMCLALKATKGRLEHLDLTGNVCLQTSPAQAAVSELRKNGEGIIKLHSSVCPHAAVPYDDDP